MVKLGFCATSHSGTASIFGASGGLRRGQHHVQPGHRRLQFRAQLAPAAHRLHVIHAGHQRAHQQPLLHALAEIAEPRARPFVVGGGALGERDQRAAGVPILQRRQRDFADLGAKIAERAIAASMPRCVPALTLWSTSWKWWMTPMRMPLMPVPSCAV